MMAGREMTAGRSEAFGTDEDFSAARRLMVLGQLTPNGVNDPLLLAAFEAVPREFFVPPAQRHRAYADQAVPLPEGREVMAPMVLARLLQQALPQPGERALVLGAGTGYGAAVLARMGLKVLAIESDSVLADAARDAMEFALTENRPEIMVANPREGFPAGAPFRLILIEGAVPAIPPGLASQLGEGGRIVTVRRGRGEAGRALLLRRMGGSVSELVGLDAAAALLPDFTPEPGFVF